MTDGAAAAPLRGLAPAAPGSPPPPPPLRGTPALPFIARYNLSFATASQHATWTVLFFIISTLVRTPLKEWPLRVVCICYAALVAAELAWRRHCCGVQYGGCYAQLRQLALPFFICGDVLIARTGVVRVGYEVIGAAPPGLLGAVHVMLALVLASRWLTNAPVWLLCHPFIFMLPTQLMIVYNHWRYNAQTCASDLMSTPEAHALVHKIASALDYLQFGGIVLPKAGPPLSPGHECRTVLAWQQLFLSLAAPALVAAVAETRLWRRHQEERERSGLPPEGGLQARLYRTLDAWLLQSEWPDFGLMGWLHLALVVWLLASMLHTLAVLVAQAQEFLVAALATLAPSPAPEISRLGPCFPAGRFGSPMFTISIPFPSKREQRRKKGKKPGGAAAKGPATSTAAAAAAKPPRPRSAWDSTANDLGKHRLTAAEMEFRRALRQSRHRLPRTSSSQAGSEPYSQHLPLHMPLDEQQEQEEQRWPAGSEAAEAEAPPSGSLDRTGSWSDDEREQASDGSSTASLAGMRAFVAQLQANYGLGGAVEAAGEEGAPAPTTAGGLLGAAPAALPPAQRKPSLAQLLEQELERQAAELGCQSEGEEEWAVAGSEQPAAAGRDSGAAAAAGGAATSAAPQLDGSDSEGGGHLGPAALRRAQRRQQRASAASEAAAAGAAHPAAMGSSSSLQQQQALLARLAAAEAQLERFSGLEAALGRTQAEVQELRQQNAQLQTELNDFVAHTGTLITSLQLQLSSFMSGGQGGSGSPAGAAGLAAAGRLPPPRPLSPASQVAAVPAAVMQARAAAEAVAIAQQAHARSAATAAAALDEAEGAAAATPAEAAAPAAQPAGPAWQDALADVQLPSFRSFAWLQSLAAAGSKPPPVPPTTAAPSLDPCWSAGWAVDGGSAENSPPEPRALPSGLQQWRSSSGAAGGGFEWRPMSAAG
ncbi:hypothetical protein C2E21_7896 [Chlorella sorokiniana]|uniref:Uncharacterized protein n=1 Tax=Chlorella sorokiniana TaxID=3076 RepID=A0A2P6TG59_CHLSO|nr:hypothetical protein C2E21_7896 [Chlorella sorokiniana]|eukprot:PRW33101.1 hypothetical protein C2E21_7896 [Chlorella sorokiniana]